MCSSMTPTRTSGTPASSAASDDAYSCASRSTTSGRQPAIAARIPGSALRAKQPAKTSRITTTAASSSARPASDAKIGPTSSAGGSSIGSTSRLAASPSTAAERGTASATSAPERRRARANGKSGPT